MTSSAVALGGALVASCLLAFATVAAAGCGGQPTKPISASGKRLPANDTPGVAPLSALPDRTISRADWENVLAARLMPSCEAHEGVRTADAYGLDRAEKVIDSWTELHATKGKSRTAAGRKVGGKPEPTRLVSSIGMTCEAGASTLEVNGVRYPFDIAWVVSGRGTGITLDGDDDAGWYTMIQALSFADQRVIFAKVFVPSNAFDDTDDTLIVTNLEAYLPANPDVPIVRSVGDPEDPHLETFIAAKDARGVEGISLQVPRQGALGQARYFGIARFTVTP